MIKVIIADDEEKVCQLIYNLVDWKEKDMEVVGTAHNGIEALECVERLRPDLMITDIRMPGYDGLELIQKAKEAHPDVECIIISGYRHFEYAQNAIKFGVEDYLLKPINKEELNKTLDKICCKYQVRMKKLSDEEYMKIRLENDTQVLRMKFYADLKENKTDISIQQINESYHYKFREGLFQVFIVKFDFGRHMQSQNSAALLKGKIRQIIEEVLEKSCMELESFSEEGRVCCIINYEETQQRSVYRRIRTALDEMLVQRNIFGNVQFTIGRGEAYKEISKLGMSFRQALNSLEERIILGTDRVIDGIEDERNMELIDSLTADFMKEADSALETLNREGVSRALEHLQTDLLKIRGIAGSGILHAVRETGKIYAMGVRKYGMRIPGEQEFLKEFSEGIECCPQADEVFKFAQKKILDSLDKLIEEKNQESTRPIRMAKQYIKKNYKKPITLEEVSSYAGFNATYFSSLFKKESGMNFLEYLSEVRMNRAKELLKETNMSVAVICGEVGYTDIKYFTKSFKKITGINPKDYRKLYS